MFRPIAVASLLTFCSVLRPLSPAAADEVLRFLPDSASAVVVVNNPAELDAKVQSLSQAMQMPLPSLMAVAKLQLGLPQGFDEDRPIALIVLDKKTEKKFPASMLLLPVSDYDKFVEPLKRDDADGDLAKIKLFGTTLWTRHIGDYAVLAEASERSVLESLKPADKLSKTMSPWSKWLAAGDAGAIILKPGVERISGEACTNIARMKKTLEAAGDQGKSAAAGLDMYDQAFQAAEKEVTACGLRIELKKDNSVRFVGRVALAADGEWARLTKTLKPSKEDLLDGLVAEPFVVAAGGVVSDEIWQAFVDYSGNLIASMPAIYGLDKKQAANIFHLGDQPMKGSRAIAIALLVGDDDEPVYARLLGTLWVDDSQAFLDSYAKYVAEYNKRIEGVKSPILKSLEVERMELDGVPALTLKMKMPEMPSGLPGVQGDKIMQGLFGPGGQVVSYLVAADKHRVVMGYVTKGRAVDLVKAIQANKPGLAGDANLKKTAAMLPSDALSVGFLNPRNLIKAVQQLIAATSVVPQNFKLPDFPETPPIGWAVTRDGNAIDVTKVVPGEILTAIQPYIIKIQKAQSRTSARVSSAPAVAQPLPHGMSAEARTRPAMKPLVLDIAKFYNTNEKTKQSIGGFLGKQKVDGLPFAVDGLARLWGEEIVRRNAKHGLLDTWNGIKVGRPFDQLHLIHFAMWPEVEGRTVAYFLFNYADGTKAILPIRYGVQVMDWFFLPSYTQEKATDANTKIVWWGTPVSYNAPVRLFKTKLTNPSPDKVVDTIDIVSARSLSSYVLVAATTADRDPERTVTPAVDCPEPGRKYDGKLVIRVVDADTGRPIEGAVVSPGMQVRSAGVVGQQILTSASGEATIRYPIGETGYLSVRVKKDGYGATARNGYANTVQMWQKNIPDTATVELRPLSQ